MSSFQSRVPQKASLPQTFRCEAAAAAKAAAHLEASLRLHIEIWQKSVHMTDDTVAFFSGAIHANDGSHVACA